jgi:hypothetical protein
LVGDELDRKVPSVLEFLVLRKGDERAPDVREPIGDAVRACSHDVVGPGVRLEGDESAWVCRESRTRCRCSLNE